ncbi:MAG TPA: TIR domain-containing protein [Steroidobacteraceae bacterium]|nr:TIR domain-containing protein [Steroidobacteraceae bacterium]
MGGAVFLSYASEDAAAAARIATALRAAGVEVWFDQSELRGGDAWDRQIRERIHDCRLFIAVISAGTEARDEGYFRREWKLAVDRTHDMSERKTFLLPVVIDGTSERSAAVPEKFREVQWTRLTGGETPPEFAARVARLMAAEPRAPTFAAGVQGPVRSAAAGGPAPRPRTAPLAVLALVVAGLGYLFMDKVVRHDAAPPAIPAGAAPAAAPTAAAFNPPPHSIAVLPFANLSGDPGQDYFSDGLTEELLNSLAAVDGLQVAARTSSFSFKGKDTDIGTIARKLDVGAVLEGSVRRSGHTVRITAQLINAVTGFHLWSKSYDRDLGDVLRLQTEIAGAVADALKVAMLTDTAAKIEVGGTRIAAAFDAYLRGRRAGGSGGPEDYLSAAAAFTDAIRLDPGYAGAFAGRAWVESLYASQGALPSMVREYFARAFADARHAIALAPELADGHAALGFCLANGALDLRGALDEFERARTLAPGDAEVVRIYAVSAIMVGRTEAGVADMRRAVRLDPLNALTHHLFGMGLYLARRFEDASQENAEAIALNPDYLRSYEFSGLTSYMLGKLEQARATCESRPAYWGTQWCLALTYEKLGRHADAHAALARIHDMQGDAAAYQYAGTYAQWGDTARALEWLETALRLRDPGLSLLKRDPLLDPIRKEPRFQAVERALKLPD